MNILRWLQYLLDPRSPNPRRYAFDDTLLETLHSLAEQEQCSTEELAAGLLEAALARRQALDGNQQRWETLTGREQEVAALACLGCTNRQIAARLVLSPETVKTHLRSVLHKFGLRSKAELRQALAGWDFSGWE